MRTLFRLSFLRHRIDPRTEFFSVPATRVVVVRTTTICAVGGDLGSFNPDRGARAYIDAKHKRPLIGRLNFGQGGLINAPPPPPFRIINESIGIRRNATRRLHFNEPLYTYETNIIRTRIFV